MLKVPGPMGQKACGTVPSPWPPTGMAVKGQGPVSILPTKQPCWIIQARSSQTRFPPILFAKACDPHAGAARQKRAGKWPAAISSAAGYFKVRGAHPGEQTPAGLQVCGSTTHPSSRPMCNGPHTPPGSGQKYKPQACPERNANLNRVWGSLDPPAS